MINRIIERYKLYSQFERVMLITIGLALLFSVQGAIQLYEKQKFVRMVNETTNLTSTALLARADANLLMKAQLFGQAMPLQQAVPISQLNWTIQGISMLSPESKQSRVLLKINQTAKWYKAGDKLPEGVEIHSINKDNIIVKRNGEFETLRLQRNVLHFTKPYQRGGSS